MREALEEALEEIKRADHLLFVSLKYTRTVDVLLNMVNRLIEAYDRLIEVLLRLAKEKKQIEDIPIAPRERAEMVKNLYDDPKIKENVRLYELLRKIHKTANPQKENEYRRHVTLKTFVEGREEIINIDICGDYYAFIRECYNYIKDMLDSEEKK